VTYVLRLMPRRQQQSFLLRAGSPRCESASLVTFVFSKLYSFI